jgi:hypothetical protein
VEVIDQGQAARFVVGDSKLERALDKAAQEAAGEVT